MQALDSRVKPPLSTVEVRIPSLSTRDSVSSATTSQTCECLHYGFEVGEVRYESVGIALE